MKIRIVSIGALAALLLAGAVTANAADPLNLSALHGRVVYLDFWASWCVPCRQSFPFMNALEQTYGGKGLTVIAVNVDHDHADAERFLQRYSADFRVLFDPDGRIAQGYDLLGMPTSVLIDRDGHVRFRHVGFRTEQRPRYEQEIRELLRQG